MCRRVREILLQSKLYYNKYVVRTFIFKNNLIMTKKIDNLVYRVTMYMDY